MPDSHKKPDSQKACFLKEDNMAKPFLQLLIENIFKADNLSRQF